MHLFETPCIPNERILHENHFNALLHFDSFAIYESSQVWKRLIKSVMKVEIENCNVCCQEPGPMLSMVGAARDLMQQRKLNEIRGLQYK